MNTILPNQINEFKTKISFPCNVRAITIALSVAFSIAWGGAWAQTRTASVSGNWSDIATWGGESVPIATDNVIINNGRNVTIDIENAECASLTVNGGNLTSYVSIGNNNLTVGGEVRINETLAAAAKKYVTVANGALNCSNILLETSVSNDRDAYISITGSGSISVSGDIIMHGTNVRNYIHFSGAGTLNIGGAFGGTFGGGITSNIDGAATAPTSGTVNFNGSGAQTIPAFSGYRNLTVSGSGTKTLAAATTVNSNLTIQGSAVLDCRQFNITGNASGVMTMAAGTGLILGDPANTTANAFPTNYTNINLHLNSTVTYSANNNQNVSGVPEYGILRILSGNTANRTRTLLATTTIKGNLIIEGGTFTASLLPAAQNITVNGSTQINNNGIFNDATAGGADNFIGTVTISAGGQFINSNTSTHEFRGGITNNGTFNKTGAGTVTLNGDQTLSGISPIQMAGAVTLSAGTTVTNQGTVTLTGVLNGGNVSSTWINSTNATLNYSNATQPMGTGVLTASAYDNTVNYNLNGAQAIKSTTYFNLTTSVGGIKTAPVPLTINGDLTISGTSTLHLGTVAGETNIGESAVINGTLNFHTTGIKTVNISGNLSGTGTIIMTNLTHTLNLNGEINSITAFTTTPGIQSSVNYNRGGNQEIFPSANYRHLTISGSGTKSLSGAITVNNNLTVADGVTLATQQFQIRG